MPDEFQGPYFLNTLPMNLLTFAVHAPPYSPPGAAGGRLKLDGWLFNEIIAYFNEIIAYFNEIIAGFGPTRKGVFEEVWRRKVR